MPKTSAQEKIATSTKLDPALRKAFEKLVEQSDAPNMATWLANHIEAAVREAGLLGEVEPPQTETLPLRMGLDGPVIGEVVVVDGDLSNISGTITNTEALEAVMPPMGSYSIGLEVDRPRQTVNGQDNRRPADMVARDVEEAQRSAGLVYPTRPPVADVTFDGDTRVEP